MFTVIRQADKLKYKTKKFLKNNIEYVPLAGMLAVTGIVAANLRTLPSTAETNSNVDASVGVPEACSFVGVLDSPHTAEIVNGQYKENIGQTTLRTYCNDANSYTIYAVGYTKDTADAATGTVGNNKLINYADDDTVNNFIPTGILPYDQITSQTASRWGMKLTAVAGSFTPSIEEDWVDKYGVVPASSTKVASYTSTTVSGQAKTDSSLTATYVAFVSATQPAGNYNGQVKYTMIHDPARISDTIDTITYMQDINSDNKADIMNSMEVNKQYTLIDNRDNKTYYLAKLETSPDAPGNPLIVNGKAYQVWMTQNLDLCIGCEGTAALTSENTDLNTSGSGIYASGYTKDEDGVITWTPVETAVTSGRTAPTVSGNTISGWSTSRTVPYSAEGGDVYIITSGNNDNDSITSSCGLENTVCPHYLRGNYYNWSAAVASNNTSSISSGNVATNSVCPAGWMLPMTTTSSYNTDLDYLLSIQGITVSLANGYRNVNYTTDGFLNIRSNPLYLVRGGNTEWNGSILNNVGVYGYYRGSLAVNTSHDAMLPVFSNDNAAPSSYYDRAAATSLRCLVR